MKSDGQAEKSKSVYHEFEPGFGTDLFCFSSKARPKYLSHLDTVDRLADRRSCVRTRAGS